MSLRAHEIELELFTHRFAAVASLMGEMLQRTALSTNVRERLDFSCGLLDAEGRLVVNAPHIPVHLGALGLCVRSVMEAVDFAPGDAVITNHPGYGGSHLPDVTLISPVFADGERIGFVASRAHHSEIGGKRPGSMPPDARCLAEEGCVIAPVHLIRAGEDRRAEVRRRLEDGPYPSRAVAENMADLDAALAANRQGARALEELAGSFGRAAVTEYMDALRQLASERLAKALARLPPASRTARERLDDGTVIAVRVQVEDGRLCVDFTGTGGVHPGNLNATPAIVTSAVLYVLRLLLGHSEGSSRLELPLNEGLLERVDLHIPPGSFLAPDFDADPWHAPAVVGGNVETSQRVVDTLLRAFSLAACSQGTMNNVLFGNQRFGYYETVCGGTGAGPGFEGCAAVHSHMTNTRITDPEVLERRYPVRLERFAIRRGSGGAGHHRGGDGAVREMVFLEPVSLSILSQHRVEAPFGLDGGQPGERGEQRLVRRDGQVERLEGVDQAELAAGDRLVLETPGGGGWGAKPVL